MVEYSDNPETRAAALSNLGNSLSDLGGPGGRAGRGPGVVRDLQEAGRGALGGLFARRGYLPEQPGKYPVENWGQGSGVGLL